MDDYALKVAEEAQKILNDLIAGKQVVNGYFNRDSAYKDALNLLKEHSLIQARSSSSTSQIDIKPAGRVVHGVGVSKYIQDLEQRINEHEYLTIEKLRNEFDITTVTLKNYNSTRWWAIFAAVCAGAALLLEVAEWLTILQKSS